MWEDFCEFFCSIYMNIINLNEYNFYIFVTTVATLVSLIAVFVLVKTILKYGLYDSKFREFLVIKLAKNLAKANITILANESLNDLKGTIINSGIFNNENILGLNYDKNTDIETKLNNKKIDLLLINYNDFKAVLPDNDLLKIINNLGEKTFIIIFAPPASILQNIMTELASKSNLAVTNTKGRLLSDIFTSLVTRPNT